MCGYQCNGCGRCKDTTIVVRAGICIRCGQSVDYAQRHCPECGAPLTRPVGERIAVREEVSRKIS